MERENKDQEPETVSATLAAGMHFVGNIEGFGWDLDAEEETGGVGAGPLSSIGFLGKEGEKEAARALELL